MFVPKRQNFPLVNKNFEKMRQELQNTLDVLILMYFYHITEKFVG